MKKVINKKTYDTSKATLVKQNTFGIFGDANGYEESLYQTKDGAYFLYTNGGSESKYTKENIVKLTDSEAKKF